jgi:hypothetical protein
MRARLYFYFYIGSSPDLVGWYDKYFATEAQRQMLILLCFICRTENGAALAANNPSDHDEFPAEAAPTKLKTSLTSVANI